ncbi:bifunctional peptidase and arginyl-hydroxylase JMJD5 isoform X2 [Phlebotomus argentipes]|nr:bifunctional peptidase and arginyl-hydroxylase JMJD5 isoform X2 [Phlebotomus argentipes]
MLHIGHWKDVDIKQRIVYSLATFLEVCLLLQKGNLIECLKELDAGILLGAPLMSEDGQDILRKSASLISEEISRREEVGVILMSLEIEMTRKHEVSVGSEVDVLDLPSMQEFRERFYATGKTAILQNCIDHWPAKEKWTDLGYFIRHFGHRTVPIEIGSKYTESNWGQKLVPLKDFIERQFIGKHEDTVIEYLAQHDLLDQIPELKEDIRIPDYCHIGSPETEVEVKMWFGPCGTVSPLHFDKKHNLLAQVVGRKRILLAHPQDSDAVYPYSGEMLSNTSQVDLESIDEARFPRTKQISFCEVFLKSGEVLYIPPGWWHHVRAISNSISISFWWEDKSAKD